MNYELRIEQFSGPVEKLLELIEEKKLDITEVSLAEVTADFLNYLKTLSTQINADQDADKRGNLVADFLVVAAKLILIKSKTLLPDLKLTQEEETEIKDFTQRLVIYKEFRKASQEIAYLVNKKNRLYSREFLQNMEVVFYPPSNVNLSTLGKAMGKIFSVLQELLLETQKINIKTVKLEEKIAELLERLNKSAKISFKELSEKKAKIEIIVSFLALLHILQDRFLEVEQKNNFSDIIIKKL